jgi:hypothetical protein
MILFDMDIDQDDMHFSSTAAIFFSLA